MTESALNPLVKSMPIRAGGWVQNQIGDVAQIRAAYRDSVDGQVIMDLIFYGKDGAKIGRLSPLGGPRGYEPAVPYDDWWFRVHPPKFPLRLREQEDGTYSYILPSIPDGEYLPRPPRVTGATHTLKNVEDADIARSHRMAAQELRDTIGRKLLSGGVKTRIEERIAELERIADAAET